MCGIYGVVGATGNPARGLNAIAHRGPDGSNVWADADAGVWLGHARLAIIDPTVAGDQPMVSPDGRFIMIYNGEIYNFLELRREMEQAGERFSSQCDSEVLLRLFAREGTACFPRVRGIFAAAFWDTSERRLTLVRDPLGVKPLYWTKVTGGVAFASEIKSLVIAGDVEPRINPRAMIRHLGLLWAPGEETIAQGVFKLLPGQYLTIRPGGTPEVVRYSDPAQPALSKDSRPVAELIDQTRTMIDQAVRRQLISDVPLGAFLSGGLDSSAVVAFAARHRIGAERLRCFSIDVQAGAMAGEGFAEDLPYARQVAAKLDVGLDVVTVDETMMERLPEMIYHLDEPTPDPSALNTLIIAELARKNGIKVLLSGTGGDDIFTGYRRHFALRQERLWAWLPRPARSVLASAAARMPQGRPAGRRLAKALRYADQPDDERLISYFLWLDPDSVLGLLSDELRAHVAVDELLAPMRATLARLPEGTQDLDRMLFLECNHFLADHNLNYADKMAMACGVETRVPLLDEDLVAFAGTLPLSVKQRGRTGKWVFKRAMEGILPDAVIYRPKTGFGVPLRQWLIGPLRPLVEDTLSADRLRHRGLFNPSAVDALMDALFEGRGDTAYTVFALLCIELWCEQFVHGRFPTLLAHTPFREPMVQ